MSTLSKNIGEYSQERDKATAYESIGSISVCSVYKWIVYGMPVAATWILHYPGPPVKGSKPRANLRWQKACQIIIIFWYGIFAANGVPNARSGVDRVDPVA